MMTKTIKITDKDPGLQKVASYVSDGIEVILTSDDQPVAKILPYSKPSTGNRVPGLHKNCIEYISTNFDDPLEDNFWLNQE